MMHFFGHVPFHGGWNSEVAFSCVGCILHSDRGNCSDCEWELGLLLMGVGGKERRVFPMLVTFISPPKNTV